MNASRHRHALFAGIVLALHAASASANLPDLVVQKVEYLGGAKHGNCNTARITLFNQSMTPVTAGIPVLHTVNLGEGEIATSGTMAGGIGGNMAKTMQLSTVFLATYGATMTQAVVDRANTITESNETNNSLMTAPQISGHCAKLSVADVSAKKGLPLRFVVSMAPTTDLTVNAEYAVSSSVAQGGTSCSRGVDYIATSGRLQFAKNESSKTVEVQTCSQAASGTKSAPRSVTFTLVRMNNAEPGKATASGTITD
jgi:hypothetical protein